jgi:hypothetical protein
VPGSGSRSSGVRSRNKYFIGHLHCAGPRLPASRSGRTSAGEMDKPAPALDVGTIHLARSTVMVTAPILDQSTGARRTGRQGGTAP